MNPNQFAVVLKELASPAPERLKRAFSAFSNLTDADAVRLAAAARGILMRHLGLDAARALQSAVQAEGIGAVVVPESNLPKLPDSRPLHRVGLSADGFSTYDLMGRPNLVPWNQVALFAAGAVRHFEISRTQTDRTTLQFSPITGVRVRTTAESGHKVETDSPLLFEIILTGLETRFQIGAAQFPFRYLIDQPGMATPEKFLWTVREFCRHAPGAILNHGARSIVGGENTVPAYHTRQAFLDEILWLLWQSAQTGRSGTPT